LPGLIHDLNISIAAVAGGRGIFRYCISNLHRDIIHQASVAGNEDVAGGTMTADVSIREIRIG
jgi:hypothetical protein